MAITRMWRTPFVDSGGLSDRCGRKKNEDAFYYADGETEGVWLLADGLGGHGHGEVAAQLVVRELADRALQGRALSGEVVLNWIREANAALMTAQKEKCDHFYMRTTIAGVFRRGRRFWLYHVGDTRIYYFRGGSVLYQSKDHSVAQLAVDLGEIEAKQIRGNAQRNTLTRALGAEDAVDMLHPPMAIRGRPGDAFLLCSDGFWEYVWESEMLKDLAASDGAHDWIERMLARRAERVKEGVNGDNYTAVAGMLNTNPNPHRSHQAASFPFSLCLKALP